MRHDGQHTCSTLHHAGLKAPIPPDWKPCKLKNSEEVRGGAVACTLTLRWSTALLRIAPGPGSAALAREAS